VPIFPAHLTLHQVVGRQPEAAKQKD